MSEIAGQIAAVHESYAFACMRCGHGWEQSYAIEHHTDTEGHECVRYVVEGGVVPSPLSRPVCQNCDGHVVRIMRAGQVSSVRGTGTRPQPGIPAQAHHWHLSDLLHPFQRKAG
ncbi:MULTISPECIES: hypothetical protein [unclassified Streptomyces]|uniref:hypothetical protein n=1 Tax=unclassified Streptomyces TaxID=2593676 RepID=UPI002E2D4856|nr:MULTISPECIES: hypothetical protein [unclassified Streptomyces]WUB88334.1 hypothetical protein OG812_17830 [Streptomyces sp. NBC_00566]